MKKVALYARVSSTEQAQEGVSITAQIKQIKQYALKHNYKISHQFVDRGQSARTADRPEFQKMIALAKKKPKPFDIILIHKTDRFARNRKDSIIYKSLLRKECNIEVISITENFSDTPQGRMMEGIMEVVAEFYSANLSQEVMKGMNEQASKGFALGEPPYGYTINPETNKYDIYQPEAKVVKYIYQQYLNGASLRSIGTDLRKNGKKLFGEVALKKVSKAIRKEGKHKPQQLSWEANTVRRTLSNSAYIGEFVWNEKKIKNNHPAIIDRKDFQLIQDLLARNRCSGRNPSKDYLLKGLVKCYECGGSLSQLNQRYTTKTGEKRVYRKLRCSNHVRKGNCYPNFHDMNHIEKKVINYLKQIINIKNITKNLNIRPLQDNNLKEKHQILQQKYNHLTKQFDRQMEAYQAGIINLKELKKYKEQLQTEKKEIKLKLDSLLQKINQQQVDQQSFSKKIQKIINTLDNQLINLTKKKNVLLAIIDEIQISKQKEIIKIIFKH